MGSFWFPLSQIHYCFPSEVIDSIRNVEVAFFGCLLPFEIIVCFLVDFAYFEKIGDYGFFFVREENTRNKRFIAKRILPPPSILLKNRIFHSIKKTKKKKSCLPVPPHLNWSSFSFLPF